MSYCRFSGADAYIYLGTNGLECCGCIMATREALEQPYTDRLGITHEFYYEPVGPFVTAREMLDHIAEHRAEGHDIPEYVDTAIKEDFPDLDASTAETEEERLEREERNRPAMERLRAKMKAAYEENRKDK